MSLEGTFPGFSFLTAPRMFQICFGSAELSGSSFLLEEEARGTSPELFPEQGRGFLPAQPETGCSTGAGMCLRYIWGKGEEPRGCLDKISALSGWEAFQKTAELFQEGKILP